MVQEKNLILSAETATKKLRRMSLEVYERNDDATQILLIGIKENGCIVANKISHFLSEVFKGEIKTMVLSIDKKNPGEISLDIKMDFNNKTIVLIDDVANSGRTMLYALEPLLKSYPKTIQTLALVERTHKSFPIALDYVGLSISTNFNEHINVEVKEGEIAGAWIV